MAATTMGTNHGLTHGPQTRTAAASSSMGRAGGRVREATPSKRSVSVPPASARDENGTSARGGGGWGDVGAVAATAAADSAPVAPPATSGILQYRKRVGFVPQDNVVHEDLTVEENLWYSAQLRLPRHFSRTQKKRMVDEVLRLLRLDEGKRSVRHQFVGSVEKRGVSGGQRKLTNIGVELVADPTALFLDEPTSGLDASLSELVVGALRRMTRLGMTVVTVIHQPRFSIFTMFDKVLLLGKGGRTVYSGPSQLALSYFRSLGFPCLPHHNPADFFMDVISGTVKRQRLPQQQSPTASPEDGKAVVRRRRHLIPPPVPPSSSGLQSHSGVSPGAGAAGAAGAKDADLNAKEDDKYLPFEPQDLFDLWTEREERVQVAGDSPHVQRAVREGRGSQIILDEAGAANMDVGGGSADKGVGGIVVKGIRNLTPSTPKSLTGQLDVFRGTEGDEQCADDFTGGIELEEGYREDDHDAGAGGGATGTGTASASASTGKPISTVVSKGKDKAKGASMGVEDSSSSSSSRGVVDRRNSDDTSLVSDDGELVLPSVTTPGLMAQLGVYLRMLSTKRLRMWREDLINIVALLVAAALLGCFAGPKFDLFDGGKFLHNFNQVTLTLGVLSTSISLRTFGNHKLLFFRESAAGVSTSSYFLAKCIVDLPSLVVEPILFSLIYHSFACPMIEDAGHLCAILLGLSWACYSYGYILAIITPAGNRVLLCVIVTLLIGNFLGGTSPLLGDANSVFSAITYVAYSRWVMEGYTITTLVAVHQDPAPKMSAMVDELLMATRFGQLGAADPSSAFRSYPVPSAFWSLRLNDGQKLEAMETEMGMGMGAGGGDSPFDPSLAELQKGLSPTPAPAFHSTMPHPPMYMPPLLALFMLGACGRIIAWVLLHVVDRDKQIKPPVSSELCAFPWSRMGGASIFSMPSSTPAAAGPAGSGSDSRRTPMGSSQRLSALRLLDNMDQG